MDFTTVFTAAISVTAGIFIGCVLASSRESKAYQLIDEIKEWAGAPCWRNGDFLDYHDARMDIRAKIRAYETEE